MCADVFDKGPPLYTYVFCKFSKKFAFFIHFLSIQFLVENTFMTENKPLATHISNIHYIYTQNAENSVLNYYKPHYFQHPHPRMSMFNIRIRGRVAAGSGSGFLTGSGSFFSIYDRVRVRARVVIFFWSRVRVRVRVGIIKSEPGPGRNFEPLQRPLTGFYFFVGVVIFLTFIAYGMTSVPKDKHLCHEIIYLHARYQCEYEEAIGSSVLCIVM